MNNNQITTIKNIINDFKAFDLDKHLSTIFINKDLTTTNIGQYSVVEYVSTTKRLFKQLEEEISDNGLYLPFQYNFTNEFGSGNLQSDLSNMFTSMKGTAIGNLNNSLGFMNRLVYYQVANGFWDKSTRKIHKSSEIEITELNNGLKYIEQQTNKNIESLNSSIQELNEEKEELKKFISQKTTELQQITNNLQGSSNSNNQTATILNQSIGYSSKIEAILTQQQQNLEKSKKDIEQQQQSLNTQKENFLKLEDGFKTKLSEIEQLQNKRTQT